MRLERAEVNGDIVVYTTDCHDKFIRTKTKQASPVKIIMSKWTPEGYCGRFDFLLRNICLLKEYDFMKSQPPDGNLLYVQLRNN